MACKITFRQKRLLWKLLHPNVSPLWLYGLILLSIVLAFVLCVAFPRIGELEFDYLGVLATVFSVMITFLVGWQISSFFSYKKDVENKVAEYKQDLDAKMSIFKKINSDIKKDIDTKIRQVSSDFTKENHSTKAEFYIMLSEQCRSVEQLEYAVMMLFNGISECSQMDIHDSVYRDKIRVIKNMIVALTPQIKLQAHTLSRIREISGGIDEDSIKEYVSSLELYNTQLKLIKNETT